MTRPDDSSPPQRDQQPDDRPGDGPGGSQDRPSGERPDRPSGEQPDRESGAQGRRPDAEAPQYADRVYRSPGALAGGVLLLAVAVWLGADAVVNGEGRTPWLTLAGMLFAIPLVVAYTVRPAVFAGERLLRVRNPFRTITLPWGTVEGVRARYSSEVFAAGRKYQLWAIPVSLGARKRAVRRAARSGAGNASAGGAGGRTGAAAGGGAARSGMVAGGLGGGSFGRPAPMDEATAAIPRAPSDQAIDELRELVERHGSEARGEPQVRWAYEIIAPAVLGALLLAILIAVG